MTGEGPPAAPPPDLAAAIDALSDALAFFDSDDRLVLCNRRFTEAYAGVAPILRPGLAWRIFVTEAGRRDLARGLERVDEHLLSGVEASHTLEASRPPDRTVRITVHPARDGGFVLTETDITDALAVEEMRAEADNLLRNILDASSAYITMTRIRDGTIIYQTSGCQALFGGVASAKELYADPDARSDLLAELLPTGSVDAFNVELINASGQPFPARVTARLTEHAGERVIVASLLDMTEVYAQQAELTRVREAAHQAEKLSALGGLLAGVAHELNNPLSVIAGHAMMLHEDVREPALAKRVAKIDAAAERCAKIVKAFLSIARQKPTTLRPVSINDVVRTALDVAAYGLNRQGAVIETAMTSDAPNVLADEDQIAQALINLLANAQHATNAMADAARILVSTAHDAARGEVSVTVTDNGPGVPQELRTRIFEPFFTTKSVGEGTGLGLAICHRIAGSHNGRIDVGDGADGGAAFTITLPSASPDALGALSKPGAQQNLGLSVLLVEDEPDVAAVVADLLQKIDVETTHAASAREGLALLEAGRRFDLLLTDLKMPGVSGLQMMDEIDRRWPAYKERSAFITGDSMGEELAAIKATSGRPVLEKPIAPSDLFDLVRRLAARAPK